MVLEGRMTVLRVLVDCGVRTGVRAGKTKKGKKREEERSSRYAGDSLHRANALQALGQCGQ